MRPEELPEEALLEQMIEECGELIQAAAKLLRIDRGVNPTPVPRKDAWKCLIEETADIEVVIDTVKMSMMNQEDRRRIEAAKQTKADRWLSRMEAKSGNH